MKRILLAAVASIISSAAHAQQALPLGPFGAVWAPLAPFPQLSTNVESTGVSGLDMNNCTSASACGWFIWSTPTAYPQASTPGLRITKGFPSTGGTGGNTGSALWVSGSTGINDAGYVWNGKFELINNTVATTGAQNVALSSTIFKQLGASPPGTNLSYSAGHYAECSDQTAIVDPTGPCIGAEIDTYAVMGAGTDAHGERVALQLNGGVSNGVDAGVHIGALILLGSNNSAVIDNAVKFGTGPFSVGINLASKTGVFSTAAILGSATAQDAIAWQDTSGALNSAHGVSFVMANDNNYYFTNSSNTNFVFRGPAGDNRMVLTSSVASVYKTLDIHYAGTTTCAVTGSIAVQINGVAHAIPYC